MLHEVCDLDHDKVLTSAAEMKDSLLVACKQMKVWALGVVEIELVNLPLLKRIQEQTDVEKRKLQVLRNLIMKKELDGLLVGNTDGTKALVHAHVVVDFGYDADKKASEFDAYLRTLSPWNRVGYQVRLEELRRNKSMTANLKAIAAYGTKGGNERLRYKAGFGRDLNEDLDAKIFKAGGTGKKHKGGETLEDERSLTVGELAFLNEVYERLMRLRRDRRGYLIKSSR